MSRTNSICPCLKNDGYRNQTDVFIHTIEELSII